MGDAGLTFTGGVLVLIAVSTSVGVAGTLLLAIVAAMGLGGVVIPVGAPGAGLLL